MKKFTILLVSLLIFTSCGNKEENLNETNSGEIIEETSSGDVINEKQEGVIENTVNIIDSYYTETLPGAIHDARDVVNDINKGYENMQKEIDSLR